MPATWTGMQVANCRDMPAKGGKCHREASCTGQRIRSFWASFTPHFWEWRPSFEEQERKQNTWSTHKSSYWLKTNGLTISQPSTRGLCSDPLRDCLLKGLPGFLPAREHMWKNEWLSFLPPLPSPLPNSAACLPDHSRSTLQTLTSSQKLVFHFWMLHSGETCDTWKAEGQNSLLMLQLFGPDCHWSWGRRMSEKPLCCCLYEGSQQMTDSHTTIIDEVLTQTAFSLELRIRNELLKITNVQ